MAFNQNLKEYFHQNQNSIPTPMVSLGYLWENRRGVYSILPKSEGEFSSMFAPFSGLSTLESGGGGVLPYVGYIGMYRCEGCGFWAVYSSIGYINQRVWV